MVCFSRYVEAGRLAFIVSGPFAKKVALIVEVIDQNRVLIDGPCSGVPRQQINIRRLHLSAIKCKLAHGCGTAAVERCWTKNQITEKWDNTKWARKLARKALRTKMDDFDRFKVMVARQKRNKILKSFSIAKPVAGSVKKVVKSK